MDERQAVLIYNPRAGRNVDPSRPVEEFRAAARARGVDVEVVATAGPNDAARLAAAAVAAGARAVVVRGGDGTLHEAIQGLAGRPVRVGLWPAGTANVLARQLGLPSDAAGAAEVFTAGKTKRISLGCATDERTGARRYFFMLAGVGLDASVVRSVRPRLKRRVGQAAYWYAGLAHLAHWRPQEFTVEAGGRSYPATYAAVGKAPWYGGGLAITPRARLDADEFEVCLINTRSRLRYLRLLGHAMRGGAPEGTPALTYLRASRLRVHGQAAVQADGELIGELPMTFEIVPDGLELFVP